MKLVLVICTTATLALGAVIMTVAGHPTDQGVALALMGNNITHHSKSLPNIAAISDKAWQAQRHAENMQRAAMLNAQIEQFALSHVDKQALAESSAYAPADEDGDNEHVTEAQLAGLGLKRP